MYALAWGLTTIARGEYLTQFLHREADAQCGANQSHSLKGRRRIAPVSVLPPASSRQQLIAFVITQRVAAHSGQTRQLSRAKQPGWSLFRQRNQCRLWNMFHGQDFFACFFGSHCFSDQDILSTCERTGMSFLQRRCRVCTNLKWEILALCHCAGRK